mmetsp:Transcript_32311/g.77240  ORF Transcript_32311/g.77240 Transcript_32311/m.77240 type:complete len:81 (+) Transcript_32311:2338-2580(+)
MVTFGLSATSPESQKARQISVMKKILDERSNMFPHDVGKMLSRSATEESWREPRNANATVRRCPTIPIRGRRLALKSPIS